MHRGYLSGLVLTATVLHADLALCLIGGTFLLIFLGVVLPAVWSTKPARRRAATTVLTKILNALRGHSP